MVSILDRAMALLLAVVACPRGEAMAGDLPGPPESLRMSWEMSSAAAADRAEQVLRNHADSGLNAMMYMARLSYLGDFALDEAGRVTMRGLIPQNRPDKFPLDSAESFARYARMAQQHGVDLYVIETFYEAERQKLEKLGPYEKIFVGGYTRYEPFGQALAPAPLEEKYWLGQLLESAKFVARLSLENPAIKGFMFDAEMYGGGGIMYRNHSSFDDQTYAAVIKELRRRDVSVPKNLALEKTPIARRFFVLEEHDLLDTYFQIQEDLVADLARRFRREIDAINPDFVLGFYPYLPCWHSNGWARGLATQRSPVVLLSAFEYPGVHVPQTLAHVEQVRALKVPHRFLAGFMPHSGRHTPASLSQNIRRALDLRDEGVDGYWIFSTTPFTTLDLSRAEPAKLSGPQKDGWWITASPDQFWSAIMQANQDASTLSDQRLFRPGVLAPAGSRLLTNNRFFPGPREEDLRVTLQYSHPPDLPSYEDPRGEKPFGPGSVGWRPLGKDKAIVIDTDLTKSMIIEKIFLLAGHHGETHFPIGGTLRVSTSVDGKNYYDVLEINVEGGQKLRMPFGQEDYGYVLPDLGIEARHVRVSFVQTEPSGSFPDVDKRYKAFALDELAVWGRVADR